MSMRPVEGSGDLTLTARSPTPQEFEPYGSLLRRDETRVVGAGKMMLSMRGSAPGPRRVANLTCYPEASRVVVALGGVPLWIVVVSPAPDAQAAAFVIPPDTAMTLHPGIWHAGPWPLSETTVCELLETPDAIDRMDRQATHDLMGADGIRVVLPEEPLARPQALDLGDPASIHVDQAWRDRLCLAAVQLEALDPQAGSEALDEECGRVTDGLRALWGHARGLEDIPGVQATREHLARLGFEAGTWPDEVTLREVLRGGAPRWGHPLDAVRLLCFLRMRVPISFLDAEPLRARLTLRAGPSDDVAPQPGLFDAAGPVATPTATSARVRPGAGTRRLVALLWLPPQLDRGAMDALVGGVVATIQAHCGGRVVARRVVDRESDGTRDD